MNTTENHFNKKANNISPGVKLILLILPAAIIFIWYILKDAAGPFYLNFADPSYPYLISSLNLAQFSSPYHFDHPGTTVQSIGALIIRFKNALDGSGETLPVNVLSNPEHYLFLINFFCVILIAAGLFWLGLFVSKLSGSVYMGIFAQLSCFTSEHILFGLGMVSPENFLVFVVIIFIGLIFYYLYENPPEDSLKLIITWGLICGAGVATKLNFIPLLLIPLFLIKGLSRKALFSLFTVAAFFLFTLPVITKYKVMFGWTFKLFTGSGMYGKGDQTIVSMPELLSNIKTILFDNILFLIAYLTSFVLLVYTNYLKLIKKLTLSENQKKYIRLISGIFIAMTIQIFVVGKHYKSYYMLPSLMLTMSTFFISYLLITSLIKKTYNQSIVKTIFPVLAVIIVIINIIQFQLIFEQYRESKAEAIKVNQSLNENYKGEFIIPTFATSNSNYGLALGLVYSGKRKEEYKNILANKLTSLIYYDPWQKKIFSFEPGPERKDYFSKDKTLIFHTTGNEYVKDFTVMLLEKYGLKVNSVTELETFRNGDKIYRLNF